MKILFGIICVFYINQIFAVSSINFSNSNARYSIATPNAISYIGSVPIKFDLLLDEKVTADDPRIKSIIYTGKENPKNTISISYVNTNASALANHLADIFLDYDLVVLKPMHVTTTDTESMVLRYVTVVVNYFKLSTKIKEADALNAESSIVLNY